MLLCKRPFLRVALVSWRGWSVVWDFLKGNVLVEVGGAPRALQLDVNFPMRWKLPKHVRRTTPVGSPCRIQSADALRAPRFAYCYIEMHEPGTFYLTAHLYTHVNLFPMVVYMICYIFGIQVRHGKRRAGYQITRFMTRNSWATQTKENPKDIRNEINLRSSTMLSMTTCLLRCFHFERAHI